MRPLKFLHLTDLYAPSIGGMEFHIQCLTQERARRGHQVSILTISTNGETGLEVTEEGVRVHRIAGGLNRLGVGWGSSDKPQHPPAPDLIIAREIRRVIDEEQPDVIHAHNWIVYSYLAIKKQGDPPVVYMQHDYALACPKKTALFEPSGSICDGPSLMKCLGCSKHQYGRAKGALVTIGHKVSNAVLHNRIDRIVANSEFTAHFAAKAFSPKLPIEVVGSFISDDAAQVAEETTRPDYLPKDGTYILYVGALGTHKGVYDLIEAYESLGEDRPPLVVLGAPKDDMPKSWPKGTIVREKVPNSEVMSAWRNCAFGVIPSKWAEPLGLVAVEAGAVSKAVIATDAGGLRDVVLHEQTGLLVPPGDPKALATAMRRLIDNPGLAEKLGRAALKQSKKFRCRVVTDLLDKIAFETIGIETEITEKEFVTTSL